MKWSPLIKEPSAFFPIVMSAAALAIVFTYLAMHGVTREPDEGTAAHLWQLLMAGQIPVIAFFAIKWLPRRPRQSLLILALQAFAWIIPIVAVIWLESL